MLIKYIKFLFILYSQAGSWKNYPCPCKGKPERRRILYMLEYFVKTIFYLHACKTLF